MKDRIKEIRKQVNLNQEKFGEQLGVTGAAISRVESGTRNASEQLIRGICHVFHVREEWLRNGTGDIFEKSSDDLINEVIKMYNLDSLGKNIITSYLNLSDNDRLIVNQFIQNIIDNQNETSKVTAHPKSVLTSISSHEKYDETSPETKAMEYYHELKLEEEFKGKCSAS